MDMEGKCKKTEIKAREGSSIPRYLELRCTYDAKKHNLIESAARATHPGCEICMQPYDFEHTTICLGDGIDARVVAERLQLEQPEWGKDVRAYERRY